MWDLVWGRVGRTLPRRRDALVGGRLTTAGDAPDKLDSSQSLSSPSSSSSERSKIASSSRWTRHLDRQAALLKASPARNDSGRQYVPLPVTSQQQHQQRQVAAAPLAPCPRPVPAAPRAPPLPPPRDMPRSKGGAAGGGAAEGSGDWAKSSGFVNKPARGWLHPDRQILDEGVCYEVRYVGCLEVNTSMKILDFETRSLVAKECINRVCEAAGLKTVDRRRKVERKVAKMLSERPHMEHAGANIHLIITSTSLELRVMETGAVVAVHQLPNISFASGGDADTLDFVAYVAKDECGSRTCYVLECGGKWAQDVITTIGQAFDLRFKEYLQNNPRYVDGPPSVQKPSGPATEQVAVACASAAPAAGDIEYYNDLPGKVPPETCSRLPPLPASHATAKVEDYHHFLAGGHLRGTSDLSPNLIDLSSEPASPNPFLKKNCPEYANDAMCNAATLPLGASAGSLHAGQSPSDPFDMQPFEASLPPTSSDSNLNARQGHRPTRMAAPPPPPPLPLEQEDFFHGSISRKEAEALLRNNGEFLVRESQGSPGQYVLTGMQAGLKKHLLLVDPEGVVRTKDKTFDSVSHLVYYHRHNGLPIISAESALLLRNPVPKRAA